MSTTTETTLVSLFHTHEHAMKALSDLQAAGVPQQSIQTLGDGTSQSSAPEQSLTALKNMNLPAKDIQILSDGLKSGGTLLIVRAEQSLAEKAEEVFERHHANQIDERTIGDQPKATSAVSDETVISVIDEQLVVGKRKVESGGMRVFSRLVETPVEEQVTLQEEHVTVERHAVNRSVSEAEMSSLQNRSIEMRGEAEEAVVGKTARVVEEIRLEKESTTRTQQIKDTVRKTQVEVEQMTTDGVQDNQQSTKSLKGKA